MWCRISEEWLNYILGNGGCAQCPGLATGSVEAVGERATASATGGRSKLAGTGAAFQAAGSALSLSGLRLSDPLIQHHQAFTSSAGAYEAQGGDEHAR